MPFKAVRENFRFYSMYTLVSDRRESLGGEEYYNVTMDSLKPDTCTKVNYLSYVVILKYLVIFC